MSADEKAQENFGQEGVGAPISRADAGNLDRAVNETKIDFSLFGHAPDDTTPDSEKIVENSKIEICSTIASNTSGNTSPLPTPEKRAEGQPRGSAGHSRIRRFHKGFEKVKDPDEELPVVVHRMRSEDFDKKRGAGVNSRDGRLSPVEWRDEWKQRKKPNGRGMANNREEVEAVWAKMDETLPEVPYLGRLERTPELADLIIRYTMAGGTLSRFAVQLGVDYGQLYYWLSKDPELMQRWKDAKRIGVDAMAENALRVASEPIMQAETMESYDREGNLVQRAVKRYDNVYARKLAFQARCWVLSKWAPDKYGEKIERGDTDSRAARILAARKRLARETREARREANRQLAKEGLEPTV